MPGIQVFIAHPDDETVCSGLLIKLAQQGIQVHLVVATRGEGSGVPKPGLTLGETREGEMKKAASVIGATSLDFMGLVDKPWDGKGQAPDHDPETVRRQVISLIQQFNPDIVLTHGSSGEYGHEGHLMMHARVKEAAKTLGTVAPPLYSFMAWNPERPSMFGPGAGNRNDPADLTIDVSAYVDTMQKAVRCHLSQELSKIQIKPPVFESFHRQWPEGVSAPDDVMIRWSAV